MRRKESVGKQARGRGVAQACRTHHEQQSDARKSKCICAGRPAFIPPQAASPGYAGWRQPWRAQSHITHLRDEARPKASAMRIGCARRRGSTSGACDRLLISTHLSYRDRSATCSSCGRRRRAASRSAISSKEGAPSLSSRRTRPMQPARGEDRGLGRPSAPRDRPAVVALVGVVGCDERELELARSQS